MILIWESVIGNGKSEVSKSIVVKRKIWKQPEYQCDLFREGINSYKKGSNFIKIILYKYGICLNHPLSFKDLSPNSWYNFSFEYSASYHWCSVIFDNFIFFWQTGIVGLIKNGITVIEMKSDQWFIYCQQRRTWHKKFIFLITLTLLVNFFFFFHLYDQRN